ncbi:MAG: glycine cleavage system protein H [Planctomycetota bacterium]|jgi:glycine cleavage system H protein
MLAVLTILTFMIFIALDYYLNGRKAGQTAPAPVPQPVIPAAATEPVWVAGYEMPQDLLYHQGHVWARPVGHDTVEVGMDDFARQLVGKADSFDLPKVGDWVQQGSPAFDVKTEEHTAHLVTPVSGKVVEVNKHATTDDPYRRGWLCRIRNFQLADNLRNLLSGSLALRWMEDSRKQLEVQLMSLSGSVLQDGGAPSADFARHLDEPEWNHLAEEFFLVQQG